MAITHKPFDAAGRLTELLVDDEEAQVELIRDAIDTGHTGYIAHAIGIVARARGIAPLAKEVGLSRQTLHNALREEGNPTLDTVLKVLDGLGLKLDVRVAEPA